MYLSIIDLVQDQKSVDTKDDKKIKQRQKDYKKKIDCQQNDYKKRIKGRRDEWHSHVNMKILTRKRNRIFPLYTYTYI